MDRIAEIVELQKTSARTDSSSSANKWAESKLIWEELKGKSFRQLSEEIKERGGAGSMGHLQRMKKCWQIVVVDTGIEFNDFGSMPSFSEVYHSEEVRGSETQRVHRVPQPEPHPRQQREMRSKNPHQRDEDQQPTPRETAVAWVAEADNALSKLITFPGFWPLLSDTDAATLVGLIPKIRKVLAGIEKHKLANR